ncbi:MAG: calcium/sodium antiporter [bacterium]
MFLDFALFLIGLTILYFAAEALVQGASAMALRMGIAPLIVGLTVVAFGTSAPELVVSLAAVFTDSDDISVGNIIGSNIANLAFILGLSAIIRPMMVSAEVIKREYPVMLGASVLLVALAFDGQLSRVDGAILVACMVGYLVYMARMAKVSMQSAKEEAATRDLLEDLDGIDPEKSNNAKDIARVIFGIIGLTGGAKLMVDSAVVIASAMGVSQLVIGITVVAIGTSLPELATSVVASFRGESDISVGNVVGSNVFNVLSVLGIVACLKPISVGAAAVQYDVWVMLAVTLLIWPVMWTGKRISRIEGGLFLVAYIAYSIWLFLR